MKKSVFAKGVIGLLAWGVAVESASAEYRPGRMRPIETALLNVSEASNGGVFGIERGDQIRLTYSVRDPLPHERRIRSPEQFSLFVTGDRGRERPVDFRVISHTRGSCGERILIGTRIVEGVQPMGMPVMNIRVVDNRMNRCEMLLPPEHLWVVTVTNSYPFGGPRGEGYLSSFTAHGNPEPVFTTATVEE